jgi:hypothetical protein
MHFWILLVLNIDKSVCSTIYFFYSLCIWFRFQCYANLTKREFQKLLSMSVFWNSLSSSGLTSTLKVWWHYYVKPSGVLDFRGQNTLAIFTGLMHANVT